MVVYLCHVSRFPRESLTDLSVSSILVCSLFLVLFCTLYLLLGYKTKCNKQYDKGEFCVYKAKRKFFSQHLLNTSEVCAQSHKKPHTFKSPARQSTEKQTSVQCVGGLEKRFSMPAFSHGPGTKDGGSGMAPGG